MVSATNVDAFTSYGMSGAACGARLRASAAGGCGPHGSKSRTTTATKSSARTGCDRPTLTTLLCHSERSEESFPLRTKGRGRTMPSKEEKDKRSAVKNLFWGKVTDSSSVDDLLRMTMLPLHWSGIDFWSRPGRLRGSRFQREPAPGARSATLASALPHQRNSRNVGHACRNVMLSKAKHLIQILRRSAPQNDKTGRTAIRTTRWDQTIHCSQTPQQTGINNWRQREKVERKRCSGGCGL